MASVCVNHDYPSANAMLVVNDEGDPVADVTIRIYDALEYDQTEVDTYYASTTTDSLGEWVAPVFLPEARDWVVHFQKGGDYGPDYIRITT